MRIILKIGGDGKIKLSLFEGKRERDSLEWKDKNSLSRLLLVKIDLILRRNGLGLDKISKFEIMSEVPKKWTSYRIAQITLKSLELAK